VLQDWTAHVLAGWRLWSPRRDCWQIHDERGCLRGSRPGLGKWVRDDPTEEGASIITLITSFHNQYVC
jgi:hypothetical protein